MNDPEVTRYMTLTTGVTPGMEEEEAFVENEASQKALERIGYKREGVLQKRMRSEGRWHDTIAVGQTQD